MDYITVLCGVCLHKRCVNLAEMTCGCVLSGSIHHGAPGAARGPADRLRTAPRGPRGPRTGHRRPPSLDSFNRPRAVAHRPPRSTAPAHSTSSARRQAPYTQDATHEATQQAMQQAMQHATELFTHSMRCAMQICDIVTSQDRILGPLCYFGILVCYSIYSILSIVISI